MLDINIKHLEMIQAVVSRLSNIQTTLKGWAITLLTAYITLTVGKDISLKINIAIIPCVSLVFFILDGAYLYKEKRFRDLYDIIRTNANTETDFSMNTCNYSLKEKILMYLNSLFSLFNLSFYCLLVFIFILISLIMSQYS